MATTHAICGGQPIRIIDDYVPPPQPEERQFLHPTRVHRAYSDSDAELFSLPSVVLESEIERAPTPLEPQITRSILDLLDENFFAPKIDDLPTTAPLDPNSATNSSSIANLLEIVPFLPGESLIWRNENVILVRSGLSSYRRLLMTNYQLLFIAKSKTTRQSTSSALNWNEIVFNSIPVAAVKKISQPHDVVDRVGNVLYCVTISCKDSTSFALITKVESDLQKLITVLESVAFVDLDEVFAFAHRRAVDRNATSSGRSARSPRSVTPRAFAPRTMSLDQIATAPAVNSSLSYSTSASTLHTNSSNNLPTIVPPQQPQPTVNTNPLSPHKPAVNSVFSSTRFSSRSASIGGWPSATTASDNTTASTISSSTQQPTSPSNRCSQPGHPVIANLILADSLVNTNSSPSLSPPPLAFGWDVYDPMKEFQRQQIDFDSPNSPFRLSKLNQNYVLCNSYPSLLVVPRSVTDLELSAIANFRVENRVPVVSWYHHSTGGCLVRCGQPLEGLLSVRRCKEDEKLLQELATGSRVSPPQTLVIDARPFVNAIANKMTGAGFENAQVYQNITVEFMGIGNIHAQRDNLKKLVQSCKMTARDSEIDSGDWLHSISVILSGAVRISSALQSGTPVVVHCSDGWDRTPQLVSLAQLMLDSHYRTLRGFQVLIEKEWNSFGHRFADRIGHAQSGGGVRSREISPIFTQFIDCVFQLLQQFPESFEFNELFLATILRHLYSCRFGTFLSNSEKTKKDRKLEERSIALWHMINSDSTQWQYRTEKMRSGLVQHLQPKTSRADMKLWRSYYFQQYEWMEANDVVKIGH